MHNERLINDGIYWIGGNDRRLSLFEGVYPSERGVSYNSYLVTDDKTVLLDTVDKAVSAVFFENLDFLLKDAGGKPRKLDYVVVNHMEPDHAAALGELILRYPEAKIVANEKTFAMIRQFFSFDVDSRACLVKEGDTLCTGNRTFTFVMAPMVHWPEVMVTYEISLKILFSADAFGTFGALNGNLFADEVDFEREWLLDARRYYTNIVGKYGDQVQSLLEKAAGLEIEMLCPLHGPIWRKNIGWFVEKYKRWATYTPEDNAVMVAYASVYGNTENAVDILTGALAEAGVRNIATYDVSVTDASVIVAEAFRCSHLVFAATTYNAGIFIKMEEVLLDLRHHNLQNRNAAFIENGSWAPNSGRLMREICESIPGWKILDNPVTLLSSVKKEQAAQIRSLAAKIADSMPKNVIAPHDPKVLNPVSFFKMSYGLFLLTARDGGKDNGCIINSAVLLTDTPKRINVAVIKANYTNDLILKTGIFNVSVLTTDAPLKVFQRFGFQSGRNTDKFAECTDKKRSENGLIYAPKYANAFYSCKVISSSDWGTHTLYTAEVTEAALLSNAPSVTYQYYSDNIKPKPPLASAAKKKGYICKVCGYFHEGDELPDDFICPLCNHGADSFEKVGF
ncbi:MAG: flavin reductase [Spirochaetaceae bacterium]|jgi:flavorubredoxin/flavin reductase (DIM6/NTAB) family NADH-FMN oxidoreductase RutF|nr:flavin reductase [Spirochaetaceae bacterium]